MAQKCVQGRDVMVDLRAKFGRAREIVCYDVFMRVLDKDRVVVEQGDMFSLHTGFAQMSEHPDQYRVVPGSGCAKRAN